MQHLENDMDDLFQRAAENYPLQAGKGDWESIAKRISHNEDTTQIIPPVRNKRNKKFIALFLLLFMLAGSWLVFQNTYISNPNHLKEAELKEKARNNSFNAEIKNDKPEISSKEKLSGINENNQVDNYQKEITPFSSQGLAHGNSRIDKNIFHSKNITSPQNHASQFSTGLTDNNNSNNYFSVPQISKQGPGKEMTKNQENISNRILEFNISAEKDVVIIPANIHLRENHNPDILEKEKKELTANKKKRGTYISLIAAPDFSKVGSGSFTHTGFDVGLLLGWRLHRKLSFETGILWNKKNYNSEGKNFNMDKIRSTMPPGMVINNLKSQSSLIEIPLKIKYDFISKSNYGFFIAGGVSAYIMTKEVNTYNVTYNGSHDKLLRVYKKNNYGLPAVADLSLGYERSVSKNFNIRIEPFLKIPLQGMGVGSLSVTSAGLQLGITGRLK